MSRKGWITGLLLGMAACGGGTRQPAATAGSGTPAAAAGLSAFEQENGIGPIKEALTLGPVDHAMAEAGEKTFQAKCSACHKMGEKYVGPALGQVTTRRTPAYILNMILNPQEMTDRHPVARQLLAEQMTQMPNLGLTQDEARQVLEYLREQTK